MKTLRQLEREKLSLENINVRNLLQNYNRVDISDIIKREILKRVKVCKKAIGNLHVLARQATIKADQE